MRTRSHHADPLPLQAPAIRDGERDRLEEMALALAAAVDAKGRYAPSHSQAVARLAQVLGAHIGVSGVALFRLRLAGLLHDVGKLHVPDTILLKPARLTDAEYDVVKRHPVAAHEMLISLGLPDEARWVLHHHERRDGAGYPTGLIQEAIPLGARILAVADAYDVMVTRRVYSQPMTQDAALTELRRCPDQFDPELVAILASVLVHGRALVRRASLTG